MSKYFIVAFVICMLLPVDAFATGGHGHGHRGWWHRFIAWWSVPAQHEAPPQSSDTNSVPELSTSGLGSSMFLLGGAAILMTSRRKELQKSA